MKSVDICSSDLKSRLRKKNINIYVCICERFPTQNFFQWITTIQWSIVYDPMTSAKINGEKGMASA